MSAASGVATVSSAKLIQSASKRGAFHHAQALVFFDDAQFILSDYVEGGATTVRALVGLEVVRIEQQVLRQRVACCRRQRVTLQVQSACVLLQFVFIIITPPCRLVLSYMA